MAPARGPHCTRAPWHARPVFSTALAPPVGSTNCQFVRQQQTQPGRSAVRRGTAHGHRVPDSESESASGTEVTSESVRQRASGRARSACRGAPRDQQQRRHGGPRADSERVCHVTKLERTFKLGHGQSLSAPRPAPTMCARSAPPADRGPPRPGAGRRRTSRLRNRCRHRHARSSARVGTPTRNMPAAVFCTRFGTIFFKSSCKSGQNSQVDRKEWKRRE